MKLTPLKLTAALLALAGVCALSGGAAETQTLANKPKPGDPSIVGEEKAILTQAPFVPPPITRNHATKVVVHLEVIEATKRLADGVDYVFWTFGGDVPGSFIRVREGDLEQIK